MRFNNLFWSSGALALLGATTGVQAASSGSQPTPYKVQTPPLDTDWTYKVGTNPWPEHPRPQLERKEWKNLNGIWTYQQAGGAGDVNNPPTGKYLEKEVLIPSCIESGLSGIQELNATYMWFKTEFNVPRGWKQENLLLNFEAVDYEATVFINGQKVGHNVGGYFRFTVDVTKVVNRGAKNDLLVFVFDPTDTETIPVGKQTTNPTHIFYRSCSGIWQTVWLESAPNDHITQLDLAAAMDGTVTVTAHSSAQQGGSVKVSIVDKEGGVLASKKGPADQQFTFNVKNAQLWSPDSPTLYNVTVSMGDDQISSYTGFRSVSKDSIDGVVRPLLNGEFHFLFGTLDQGFWPDGIYAPPNREAMISDLQLLKSLGFNSVRKHIKVEPDLFYQACDEIGLMVIQDMPALPANGKPLPNDAELAEFNRQFKVLINEHKSYTCIIAWIIYNEGWGQMTQPPWPEASLTEYLRQNDPSRLVDSVTGWYDHGYGDFSDNHHYANPQCGSPFWSLNTGPYDPSRIGFQGEFGGLGHNVSAEHLWKVEQAILGINQTYEINNNLDSYNYRAHTLFREFREQIEMYACSGGIWTQTTDVEGEVNGLVTYDRRFHRTYTSQWQSDIQSLYTAAAGRGGAGNSTVKLF